MAVIVLLVIAIVLFVAAGVLRPHRVELVAFGLAAFAAAHLPLN